MRRPLEEFRDIIEVRLANIVRTCLMTAIEEPPEMLITVILRDIYSQTRVIYLKKSMTLQRRQWCCLCGFDLLFFLFPLALFSTTRPLLWHVPAALFAPLSHAKKTNVASHILSPFLNISALFLLLSSRFSSVDYSLDFPYCLSCCFSCVSRRGPQWSSMAFNHSRPLSPLSSFLVVTPSNPPLTSAFLSLPLPLFLLPSPTSL